MPLIGFSHDLDFFPRLQSDGGGDANDDDDCGDGGDSSPSSLLSSLLQKSIGRRS